MARWLPRDQRGFTLIEMMVVLAIIALIAIFAIPNIVQALQNGRIKTVAAQARQIQVAFDEYYNDYVGYPLEVTNDTYQRHFGASGLLTPYVSLPANEDDALFKFTTYKSGTTGKPQSYCMVIETKNVAVTNKYFEIKKTGVTQTSSNSCTP